MEWGERVEEKVDGERGEGAGGERKRANASCLCKSTNKSFEQETLNQTHFIFSLCVRKRRYIFRNAQGFNCI